MGLLLVVVFGLCCFVGCGFCLVTIAAWCDVLYYLCLGFELWVYAMCRFTYFAQGGLLRMICASV